MNKKLLLSIICCIFMANCFAQKTYQQSDLVGKWQEDCKDCIYNFFLEFSDMGNGIYYVLDVESLLGRSYCLSDTVINGSCSEKSKVYENTEGKYLIYNGNNQNYEIGLTKNKLMLKPDSSISIYITNEDSVLYMEDLYNYLDNPFCCKNFTNQTFKKSDIGNKYFVDRCVKYDFYLSDTIETTFDESKVGKSTKGKYIVQSNINYDIGVFKILKLTDSKLILKSVFPLMYKKKYILQAIKK